MAQMADLAPTLAHPVVFIIVSTPQRLQTIGNMSVLFCYRKR